MTMRLEHTLFIAFQISNILLLSTSSNEYRNLECSWNQSTYRDLTLASNNVSSICTQCNKASRYDGLCQCFGWKNRPLCLEYQMTCKKECGVCLPNLVKTPRTWPKCYDHSDICKNYKYYGYCQLYPKWMKFICKYSCGHCDACKDEIPQCGEWKEKGLCKNMSDFMLSYCRESCGACDCHDRSLYCRKWADNHQCEHNAVPMKLKCPYSCGVCAPKEVKFTTPIFPTESEIDLFEKTTTKPTIRTKSTTPTMIQTITTDKPSTMTTMKVSTTTTTVKETTKQTTTKTLPTTTTTTIVNTTTVIPPTVPSNHQHASIINEEHCGIPPITRVRRIVKGGELEPPRSWPWMVGISFATKPDRVDCGGSLLTDEFILSAAHCFARSGGVEPSKYTIRLGEHDVGDKEGPEHFAKIDQIYIHQKYDSTIYDYDIAVARLSQPVNWTGSIRPACIVKHKEKVEPGTFCYVAGWGYQAEGVPGPAKLKIAKVPIVDLYECSLTYSLLLETVTDRMLCASGDGNADSCEGDSGGPLVCIQPDGNYHQVGVVSWGVGCNRKDMYGVYTDIAKQRKWLDKIVKTHTRRR